MPKLKFSIETFRVIFKQYVPKEILYLRKYERVKFGIYERVISVMQD